MTAHEGRTKILAAVDRWLGICAEFYRPIVPQSFLCDAKHSSLLPWLLSGREPLPEPPPLFMSRPWHALIADGRGETYGDVWWRAAKSVKGEQVFIGQCPWTFAADPDPSTGFILATGPGWGVYRVTLPPVDGAAGMKPWALSFFGAFTMERVDEPPKLP